MFVLLPWTKMDNSDKIRARIQKEGLRGDWVAVADKLGKSVSLVHKVVAGSRQNDEVLAAFVKLLDIRASVVEQFQTA
jgi:hypothetical protein